MIDPLRLRSLLDRLEDVERFSEAVAGTLGDGEPGEAGEPPPGSGT